MDLRPAEVTSILAKEIENYEGDSRMQSVGTVLSNSFGFGGTNATLVLKRLDA